MADKPKRPSDKLTVNQEKFCQLVLTAKDASEAYRGAYSTENMKPATVNREAKRLLDTPKIATRITELKQKAEKKAELSVERVLQEMMRLAFYDLTLILDEVNGVVTMKDPRKLPEDLRRAIVQIKPVEVGGEKQYECKFADKQKSLDQLARHLQMFKDTLIVENVFRVVQDMDDDELNRRIGELERSLAEQTTLDPVTREGTASVH